ncbi:MAG TPA: biopolymer transporter ExbD [Rhodocyclaceae bacterium]|nr:biopolymer transporter ExbD [Rhodocyclaceae bacterium]
MGRRDYGAADADPPLAEINMVPMIDVMLVLLVIFMVTVPLLTHSVEVDLPRATASASQPPEHMDLVVREDGALFWNNEPVTADRLAGLMADAGRQAPPPELRILADRRTAYEHLAKAMALASRSGLGHMAFVSTPES